MVCVDQLLVCLRNPLAAEDERNVPELPEWYSVQDNIESPLERNINFVCIFSLMMV